MIRVPVHCLAMVIDHRAGLCGLHAGGVREAWSRAADLSARIHIVTKKQPFRLVFGVAPTMYDEIWTAGKVMYKLEQVVADQGTLIIYAPHIREVSRTWGRHIEAVGYHIREYLLAHLDCFKDVPRGVLAHLTHAVEPVFIREEWRDPSQSGFRHLDSGGGLPEDQRSFLPKTVLLRNMLQLMRKG